MSKILVIEDDCDLAEDITEILILNGFETKMVVNSLLSLQLIKSFQPDLIICDTIMPFLDGYGVLKALRADPDTATIPLILMPSHNELTKLYTEPEIMSYDYLYKPFGADKLLEIIARNLI